MIKKYGPLLFTLYMTLIGGNFIAYSLILPLRIAHHILLTLILVYWFVKHGLPKTPLLLPVAGMAAAVLVSIPASADPRMALENAWSWITNLGVFLMLIGFCRQGYVNQLFAGQFASSGVLSGSSIMQGLLTPGVRVAGVFGITNLTGGYSAASVMPTLGWAQLTQSRKSKLILYGLVAGQLLTLYLNQSRGPFISLGAAALVLIAPRILKHRKTLLLVIPIVILIGIPIAIWGSQRDHTSGDVLRLDIWRSAIEMLIEHPAGVGAGVFGQVYRQIGTADSASHGDVDTITGAHNLYLNVAAELGWPGIAAGAAFLAVGGYLLTKVSWNATKWAVFAALVGILAHMAVDNFPTQNWTFLASLYVAYLLSDHQTGFNPQRATLPVVLSLIIFLWVMGFYDRAQIKYEQSLQGDMTDAMEAVELDPGLKLYRLNVARLEGGLGAVQQLDPTINSHTNLATYALVNYGRYWS